ncbi:MAG TPA: potassium/proton antiporter [Nocardioidaceae bacterium]|nr:potassium/proton antiporter [Nocardioidaceae bacterium]
MSLSDLNLVLLGTAGVLLLGVAAVRVASWMGLPSLLLYLAMGLLMGESGLGLTFSDAHLTQVLGTVALAVILAEGGLTTRWQTVRPVLGLSLTLATLGVGISVVVTSSLVFLLLDVDLRTAVLLGCVISSTDAAATFAVMRTLPVGRRLRSTLEAESGFNDPPVIILVTVVTSDAWDSASAFHIGGQMLYQLVGGLVAGIAVARTGQALLSRMALPSAGLYPLATLAICFAAFAAAGLVGASGLLAIYVAGLWLGNATLPHRQATLAFNEGLAWFAQIGLFVLLGLLASPSRLVDAIVPALIVGSALTFVARPVSVLVCASWFRVPLRQQAFLSWAGLRGAVPIVLATIPVSVGLASADRVFDVVFLLVVTFTLVQGPTLGWAARQMGLVESTQTREIEVDSAPLEAMAATVLQVDVTPGSRLAGVSVTELMLPPGAVVTLVLRDGSLFVPTPASVFAVGDRLMIAAPSAVQRPVERRLRAVARAGRLAGWRGENGEDSPRTTRRAGSLP